MHSIDLLPNEGILAQFDNVGCESPDFKGFERGELTLTNMNLVFVYIQVKMFGKDVPHTFAWPLRDIKVVSGKPQLVLDKRDNHQCDVIMRKGKLELRMASHADLVRLANSINHELTGSDEDIVGAQKTFISDLANTITGATKEFTQAFGIGGAKTADAAKTVSAVCSGCGATLHGKAGSTVICEYCSTARQL